MSLKYQDSLTPHDNAPRDFPDLPGTTEPPDHKRIVGIVEHRNQVFVATESGLYHLGGEGLAYEWELITVPFKSINHPPEPEPDHGQSGQS